MNWQSARDLKRAQAPLTILLYRKRQQHIFVGHGFNNFSNPPLTVFYFLFQSSTLRPANLRSCGYPIQAWPWRVDRNAEPFEGVNEFAGNVTTAFFFILVLVPQWSRFGGRIELTSVQRALKHERHREPSSCRTTMLMDFVFADDLQMKPV